MARSMLHTQNLGHEYWAEAVVNAPISLENVSLRKLGVSECLLKLRIFLSNCKSAVQNPDCICEKLTKASATPTFSARSNFWVLQTRSSTKPVEVRPNRELFADSHVQTTLELP
ncbi:uncharacterized protein [Physcomitrium patens]|uniref:uncharacterized protein n=1 Tax=Physcomitrium patens TaxID=3218 RepID=UPI003CCDE9AD